MPLAFAVFAALVPDVEVYAVDCNRGLHEVYGSYGLPYCCTYEKERIFFGSFYESRRRVGFFIPVADADDGGTFPAALDCPVAPACDVCWIVELRARN